MGSCNGNCGGCTGCAKQLTLTDGEVHILKELGQIPFLPVARRADEMTPIYLEDTDYSKEEYSLILQVLEKKGLITLDFHTPLKGFDDRAYGQYPIRGSMALTERGYLVLELLERQGIQADP